MDINSREDREYVCGQVLASLELEGFKADDEYLTLMHRFIEGDITMAQYVDMAGASYGVDKKSGSPAGD